MEYKYTRGSKRLTNDQRAFYERNGYILIRNNVDHQLLDKLCARFIEICENEDVVQSMYIHKDISLKKKGLKGQYVVNKIQDFVNDDVLWEYCIQKSVLDVVEDIIGPNITAAHTMLINKPPDSEDAFSRHPVHQDLHYFPFRPADRIVTTWTAMEKINEKNGCLFVVPGSHLNGILYQHDYPEGSKHIMYHEVREMAHIPRVNVVMEKGDTLFFHPLLLHGSGPNRTKGFRKAISCHYADTDSTFIDVRGTVQQNIHDEVMNYIRKRGVDLTFTDVWRLKSRLARGPPGSFQAISSHL